MLLSTQKPSGRFVLFSAMIGVGASVAAAQSQHFDVNGTTAGSGVTAGGVYSWEDANWSADNTATAGSAPVVGTGPTQNFVDGEFARFAAGTDAGTNSYTVTANANHTVAGMYVQANGGNVTVNGTGVLSISPGYQGFLVNTGRSLTINSVLGGTGGVQPNLTGSLYLYGANTYTGGTNLNTGTLTYFNSASSFGTGAINLSDTNTTSNAYAPILASGGTTITLANNFTTSVAAGITTAVGINFASSANTPVVSTGNWALGAINVNIRNNGGSTSPVTLSGVISGGAGVTLSGNTATGLITFNNVETYAGPTTIGVVARAADTTVTPNLPAVGASQAVRLRLGVAGAIASSSSVVLGGGTLDPGGVNQIMSATTLGLTAASTIDFSIGASELDFANSAAVNWTGPTLNLVGFNPSIDKLRFGTDAGGLTQAQLAKIQVGGTGLGSVTLDANGFVVVPEPTSLALLGLGATSLLRRRRLRVG